MRYSEAFGPALLIVLLNAACARSDGLAPPQPTLEALTVSPPSVTMIPQAVQSFTAAGRFSDGTAGTPVVTWSATGGTISGDGTYTAGNVSGSWVVAAAASGLADTAIVLVSAPPPSTGVDTLLVVDFENLARLEDAFQDLYYAGTDRGTIVTNPALAAQGNRFLESSYTASGSGSGGSLSIFLDGAGGRPRPVSNLRMEWSAYLPTPWVGGTRFSAIRGSNTKQGNPYDAVGVAGICPQARPVDRAFFVAETVAGEYGGNPGEIRFYTQYPGMPGAAGVCYGLGGQASGPWDYTRQRAFAPGAWHRLAHEVQLNDVGQANGVQRIWLDGVMVAEWSDLTFRTVPEVLITVVQLEPFVSTPVSGNTFQRIDDLVVTTRR